jgi:hypothetical protein
MGMAWGLHIAAIKNMLQCIDAEKNFNDGKCLNKLKNCPTV